MPYADPEVRRSYQREYQRRWIAERREAWLSDNGPCKKCGSGDDLQVDHLDPAKKITHRVWSWSTERRDAELAKCQVLCRKCHATKTDKERPRTDHGRGQMYQVHGCRCELCRAWKAEGDRRYKATAREKSRGAGTVQVDGAGC